MGRLAGPSFADGLTKSWKEKVEEAREEKLRNGDRRYAPLSLAAPSAARRQLALLWWLTQFDGDRRSIGIRNAPPLTADMRALIAKGLASLERETSVPGSLSYKAIHRTNKLVITAAGRTLLSRSTLTEAEMDYVQHAMLR